MSCSPEMDKPAAFCAALLLAVLRPRLGGPTKYYYSIKEREAAKIDGVVAGIMALGRAMVHVSREPQFFVLGGAR